MNELPVKWKTLVSEYRLEPGQFLKGIDEDYGAHIRAGGRAIRITIEVEQPAPAKVKKWRWVLSSFKREDDFIVTRYWYADGVTAAESNPGYGFVEPVRDTEREFDAD